jgi:hypothetical protein
LNRDLSNLQFFGQGAAAEAAAPCGERAGAG